MPTTRQIRDSLLIACAVGNAVTFAQLMRSQAAVIHQTGDVVGPVLTNLAIACVWPIYLLWKLFGGS
jgi:hypothetical protein